MYIYLCLHAIPVLHSTKDVQSVVVVFLFFSSSPLDDVHWKKKSPEDDQ